MSDDKIKNVAWVATERILSKNGFVCQNNTGNPVEQLYTGIQKAIEEYKKNMEIEND